MSTEVAAQLTAKQAAKMAIDFVEGFYNELGQLILDVLLEEIELSDDGNAWLITVGFSRTSQLNATIAPQPAAGLIPRFERTRQYKVVSVDRTTGEIQSMKIRTVG
jgi:hypothetical protein